MRETYWENLHRAIVTQLDWIGTDLEDQLWLIDRAIAFCQIKRIHILSGEPVTKKKQKTRHGAGKRGD